MRKFRLIIALAISILWSIGCSKSKDEVTTSDCTAHMLEVFEMVAYNGQEVGCKFFLELFEHNDTSFFLLLNHCADVAYSPIDCNGDVLCAEGEEVECEDFYKNAIRIGIIGVAE